MTEAEETKKHDHGRPAVVRAILGRCDDGRHGSKYPELVPRKLNDKYNEPYKREWQSGIADLGCHPLLESALHLMNDDLFSAHFLLRKMQEDEWGKWLHGCLHLSEGDIEKNAKLWYEQVDPKILSKYWNSGNFPIAKSSGKAEAASSGKDVESEPAQIAIGVMHRIAAVLYGKKGQAPEDDEEEEMQLREIKWKELVCILECLEEQHGWSKVDGTSAYTHDDDPSHKSMVLGEGWRRKDKGHFQ